MTSVSATLVAATREEEKMSAKTIAQPGTVLTSDTSDMFAVVIEPDWSAEQIRDAARAYFGDELDGGDCDCDYDVAVWHSYLADQKREIGWDTYSDYFGEDGAGRRSVTVAVFDR